MSPSEVYYFFFHRMVKRIALTTAIVSVIYLLSRL